MNEADRLQLEDLAARLEEANSQVALAKKRYDRERNARLQAENLLEDRARQLFAANERLEKLNSELEHRVALRTSELDAARQQALALAESDQLTGLANRRSFTYRLDQALEHARSEGHKIALICIDLDFFKDVNDTLGHHAGDELLKQIALRLSKVVRKTDLVARLGGDEFAILCPITSDENEISYLADRVADALEKPVVYEGASLEVGSSMGVAISNGLDISSQDLQRHADIALYFTKASGRGDWNTYEESMGDNVRERQKISHLLRRALDQQEGGLEVRYQPIVSLKTGKVVGAEALCRWTDPSLGPVRPDDFIAVAEETSLIYALGDFVLDRSCAELKSWLEESNAYLSVNLSPKQLKDRNLIPRIQSILQRHSVDPECLCFEVTETLFLWDITAAKNKLDALSQMGARIALDDFGTGFSNLSQLRNLPVDYLKIDRSFLRDIEHDDRALAMVKAVLAIANGMNINTVAEGLETSTQVELLEHAGGELAQGYHFAKALCLDDFWAFLALEEKEQKLPTRFGTL